MIQNLKLENWRTHKETKLEFDKGTNVIIGVMGSGKSSIMNALSYSLFGTFPALKAKQVSLNEIIMNKPNKCENAKTEIEFEQAEKKYRVERIIKEIGTNEAKLYEDEQLIAGPKQKDVNEKIENILGMNYELFSRAVYAEQNEMDFFLKLSPSERKKKFDELLELEKYENARKNTITLKNSISKTNIQVKEFIEQQKKTIESHEEESLRKKINEEEEKVNDLKGKIEKIKEKIKEKKEGVEKLEEKEKKYYTIKEELTKKESQLETLKKNLENKKEIDVKEIKEKKEGLEKKEKEIKKWIEEEEKKIKELGEKEGQIREKTRVFEFQIENAKKEIEKISKLSGKCPTCKQELNEEHKKEIIETNQKIIDKSEGEIKILGIDRKELIEKKEKIEKIKKEAEEKREKNRKESFELESLEKQAEEIERTKKEILEIEKIIPEKKNELEKNKIDEKEIQEKRKDFFETKSLGEITLNQIKNSEELLKSYKENLEKIEKIKKNIEESEKKFEKNKKVCENLGIFENCLSATQVELRQTMLETINEAMSQIWTNIYPYKDFVDAKLEIVENGYDLQVQTRGGEWVRVEGILSGGERSAAALCIRIAFALVLTKQLSMIILDEPTHNLDTNAIEKLSEMLRDSLPELVEQIFVITHDKEMETASTGKIYLLERNKDLDEATKIEIITK
jgi:DNA repair protein SbcC/Rad50